MLSLEQEPPGLSGFSGIRAACFRKENYRGAALRAPCATLRHADILGEIVCRRKVAFEIPGDAGLIPPVVKTLA